MKVPRFLSLEDFNRIIIKSYLKRKGYTKKDITRLTLIYEFFINQYYKCE